jgi:glycerol uptake facilitator protein
MAVTMAVYTVGRISGAHINPAVTIALASIGAFEWALVPGYVGAQIGGAIVGATLVWIAFLPHWAVTENKGAKRACFCTEPAIRSFPANFVCELIGTTVLVFVVLAIGSVAGAMGSGELHEGLKLGFGTWFGPLLLGLLVLSIGLSLGGPTGYAINPARDLGPRIAHAILPIAGKGGSDWKYAWVPVIAPIMGGLIGGWLFVSVGL